MAHSGCSALHGVNPNLKKKSSFQYLHNLKKQVKIEEKFKAFVTGDNLL